MLRLQICYYTQILTIPLKLDYVIWLQYIHIYLPTLYSTTLFLLVIQCTWQGITPTASKEIKKKKQQSGHINSPYQNFWGGWKAIDGWFLWKKKFFLNNF